MSMPVYIPPEELHFSFVRAGGKGGQNVNKVSTKAQLRWNVGQSNVFSADEKKLIAQRLSHKINDEGEVVMSAQEERSQLQNKEQVTQKLYTLITQALIHQPKRVPTRPTRASRRRRLEHKIQHSRKKAVRRAKID